MVPGRRAKILFGGRRARCHITDNADWARRPATVGPQGGWHECQRGGAALYALLTDGATIEIRPARPGDFAAVRDMHASMSQDNLYLRFFSLSSLSAEREAHRICREPGPDHAALLGVLDGEVVGCCSCERAGAGSQSADIAFAVADGMHHRGIGTLLLEHLVSLARSQDIHTFTADALNENSPMLRVFADAGLPVQRSLVDNVYEFTFPLPVDETDAALGSYRDTVAVRERSADVASMRPMLAPASVAVVGASQGAPESVGRVILRNIVSGGFPGPVYPVNPDAAELDGVPCIPSAAALPDHVDLAVIATPAAAVLRIAEDCGRRGVKALVVIAAGLGGPARAELLGICRRHGMRMVRLASSAWPTPASAWTRPSRAAIPWLEQQAWPCSPPAAPASCCWSTCPGWAWGSPRWSPSATRTTYPALTCCSGGSLTSRPSWPCCTWNRSGTRPSSPVLPAVSAAPYRS